MIPYRGALIVSILSVLQRIPFYFYLKLRQRPIKDEFDISDAKFAGSTTLDHSVTADQALLAVLDRNPEEKNIDIIFHSLPLSGYSSIPPNPVPRVQNFHLLPSLEGSIIPKTDLVYGSCLKSIQRNQRSLVQLFSFLGLSPSAFPAVPICTTASITERTVCQSGSLNINTFTSTTFPSSKAEYYLNIRSSLLRASSQKIATNTPIHLISGSCLFARRHTNFSAAPPKDRIPPTLYELETLLRLPSLIADVASCLPRHQVPQITLDIPRAQYYASALLASPDLETARAWLAAIDERNHLIRRLFHDTIAFELSSRGLTLPPVAAAEDLDTLLPLLRHWARGGERPPFELIMNQLTSTSPTWRSSLPLLPHMPHDLDSLSKASYSLQLISPLLQNPAAVVLQLDSPGEWRIFSAAEKAVKKIERRKGVLMGVFPVERVFTGQNTGGGRSSLYLNDPGCGWEKEIKMLATVYGSKKVDRLIKRWRDIEENAHKIGGL